MNDAPVSPVRLITRDEPASAAAMAEPAPVVVDLPLAPVAISVGGVGLALIIALFVRWRRRTPDAERAFAALSWRLGLSKADRNAVRLLAGRVAGSAAREPSGVDPVALLVAPSALEAALEASPGLVDAERAQRLRTRVINAP